MIIFPMLLIGGAAVLIGFIPWFHVHRHPTIPGDPVRGDLPRFTAICTAFGFFCLTIAFPPWLDALARVFHGKAGTSILGLLLVASILLFRYQALRRHKPRPERRWWQRKKKDKNDQEIPDVMRPQEIFYHRVFAMTISIFLGVISMVAYARSDALLHDLKTSPSTTINSANAAAAAVRSGKAGHSISAGGAMLALVFGMVIIIAVIIAMVVHHRHVTDAKAVKDAKKDARKTSRGGAQQVPGRGQAPQIGGGMGAQPMYGVPGSQPVYGAQGPAGAMPGGRTPRALNTGGNGGNGGRRG